MLGGDDRAAISRPEWPYGAASKQILSDESEGPSEAGQFADEACGGISARTARLNGTALNLSAFA